MPSSSLLVAPTVIAHMDALAPKSILDVGPGYGKYGVLFREYLATHPRVVGLEAWVPYIDQFRLAGIYDMIIAGDVLHASPEVLTMCDAIYMGDVIEHLDKDAASALLDRIERPVVVCTPEHFFHNPAGLPWTEEHRSHWTLEDFHRTGRVIREDVVYAGLVVTLAGW